MKKDILQINNNRFIFAFFMAVFLVITFYFPKNVFAFSQEYQSSGILRSYGVAGFEWNVSDSEASDLGCNNSYGYPYCAYISGSYLHYYVYSGAYGDKSTLLYSFTDTPIGVSDITNTGFMGTTNNVNSHIPSGAGTYTGYLSLNDSMAEIGYTWTNDVSNVSTVVSATPPETCTDGIKNQDETFIDIGGVCSPVTSGINYYTINNNLPNLDEQNPLSITFNYNNIETFYPTHSYKYLKVKVVYDTIIAGVTFPYYSENTDIYDLSNFNHDENGGVFTVAETGTNLSYTLKTYTQLHMNNNIRFQTWLSDNATSKEWVENIDSRKEVGWQWNVASVQTGTGNVDSIAGNVLLGGLFDELPNPDTIECGFTSGDLFVGCIKKVFTWLIFPDTNTKNKFNTILIYSSDNILMLPFTMMNNIGNSTESGTLTIWVPFVNAQIPLYDTSFRLPPAVDSFGVMMIWTIFATGWGWYIIRKIFF